MLIFEAVQCIQQMCIALSLMFDLPPMLPFVYCSAKEAGFHLFGSVYYLLSKQSIDNKQRKEGKDILFFMFICRLFCNIAQNKNLIEDERTLLSLINIILKKTSWNIFCSTHSRSVADKALQIAVKHPELHLDTGFWKKLPCCTTSVFLWPTLPAFSVLALIHICHGYLGSELLMKEGYPRHALVCERHTGAGMSLQSIIEQDLPIPHRDMVPVSMEEQVICFADKFFQNASW